MSVHISFFYPQSWKQRDLLIQENHIYIYLEAELNNYCRGRISIEIIKYQGNIDPIKILKKYITLLESIEWWTINKRAFEIPRDTLQVE